jgi:hypothetical protein
MRITAIDIVAHKKVVGLWHFASDLKQLHKVMELTMNISTDDDWSSDWYNIGLLCEYFFSLSSVCFTFSQRSLTSA